MSGGMERLIGALVLPGLPGQVETWASGHVGGVTLICTPGPGRRRVVDVLGCAALSPGVSLREALGLEPAALVRTVRSDEIDRVSGRVAVALADLCGAVERSDREYGVFYFDAGPGRDASSVIADLTLAVMDALDHRLSAMLGFALGKFPARCAASCAPLGGSYLVPAGVSEWLHGWPVDVLPIGPDRVRRLERAGVRTLGDLASASVDQAAVPLGNSAARMVMLSRGIDDEPLVQSVEDRRVCASLEFPYPVDTKETIMAGIDRLARRLWAEDGLGFLVAGGVRLAGSLDSGGVWNFERLFSRAANSPEQLGRLVAWSMDSQRADGSSGWPLAPLLDLDLTLLRLTGGRAGQLALDNADGRQAAAVRAGGPPLVGGGGRLVPMDRWSHLPERRWALGDDLAPFNAPDGLAVRSSAGVPTALMRSGRWRRVERTLDAWEVEADWWSAQPVHRRYWRLQCEGGAVLVVFRDLLEGGWFRQNA